MPKFDTGPFKAALAPAIEGAVRELWAAHSQDLIYAWALFMEPLFRYIVPTAMTEAGLTQVAHQYIDELGYTQSVEQLRETLRWSPSDSPQHLFGKAHFDQLEPVLRTIWGAHDAIDTATSYTEFNDFHRLMEDAMCDVTGSLDRAGLFGIGEDRNRIFLGIMMGDQDDSIIRVGKRLNPPAVAARFLSQWQG